MNETSVLWATGGLSVFAIMAAPLAALWVQRKKDEDKALRDRRQAIFNALWVNRRRQFWVARVDALNMIDVEFVGEEKVLNAWQELFAHYSHEHTGLNDDQIFKEREDLFATLLYEISRVLGYKFSRTHVRDNIYRPLLHFDYDKIEVETRRLVLELLKGDALPIRFVASSAGSNDSNPDTKLRTEGDTDAPDALKL
jgi:hypothetical protein